MFKFSAKLQEQLLNHLVHFASGCGSPHSIIFLLVSAILSSLYTARTGKAGRYIGIGYLCRFVVRVACHPFCSRLSRVTSHLGSRAPFRRTKESQFITGGPVTLTLQVLFSACFPCLAHPLSHCCLFQEKHDSSILSLSKNIYFCLFLIRLLLCHTAPGQREQDAVECRGDSICCRCAPSNH